MNSAPHLLNEDRQDFEHVLDDALRIALDDMGGGGSGPVPGDIGLPLNAEQLRTLALAATDEINAAAAAEYVAYLAVRTETRDEVREAASARENRAFGYAAMGVADRAGSGAGLIPVLAVLTPLLAGAAAVIFLLIGYAMHAVSPEPAIASPLRTAGWFFAALAAASALLGGIGLLLTALRDGAGAIHDAPDSLSPEVTQARERWREALLSLGMLPFLDDTIRQATTPHSPAPTPPAATPRMPHLGYSRPDFSSPQDPRPTAPRFSSPDYSSPDWGGPEHAPE
ncbi:hypothetical protein GA0115240_132731 [Streptomyces sp. DvalAA-14]|uniref:hypothetical protein n=1 Tax=unclassified Streptomyces TaxID=2593676 RepID=UPI00081AFAA7|nr:MULTISPECIES: hypothetical protein [unclassified Streptomyces]MYS21590.1 hypothetical protein [Streptomyces sp. SID4948]SCD96195.1 hypothetical protein GA0115240_132731 [Streptomyces sp. DvalAA-14]